MNQSAIKGYLTKVTLGTCLVALLYSTVPAQVPLEPERNRLLNGLHVLIWPRPGDPGVFLKLRIHSGAAFDLSGKDGTMALLGDLLFPDPTTREYFTEEMQGRLHVTSDYDSLTITMQGRAGEFERIIEILRTALVTTPLAPDIVARLREGRIKVLKETSISSATLADRAIATRLFGDFPYGRPYGGTVESLERVQRADLMLARERFLNADNATLVIIGGVPANRAMRTLRQLLGIWHKSEQVVPSTFRQPVAPDPRTLIINAPADQSVEIRLATRSFSRQDADTPAANLLAAVARQRWEKALPEIGRSPMFVRNDAYVLPGMFVMGASVDNLLAGKSLATAREALQSFKTMPVTSSELERVRSEAIAAASKELATADGTAKAWLDAETYQLPSPAEQLRALSALSTSDLQRVAMRLLNDRPLATIVVGNAAAVKSQIERYGKVEIMGEIATPAGAAPAPHDAKPETRPAGNAAAPGRLTPKP
jgi:zinc protease